MAWSQDNIVRSAEALASARREARVLGDDVAVPPTMADGYAVQDRIRAHWPDAVAGWKAGATAKPIQQSFGLDEPFAGPFFASDVALSPARLPAARFAHLAIESEFAFRFKQRLAPRATRYQREEIVAAIEAALPAFEIVSPRLATFPFGRASLAAADCAVNAAMVLGAPVLQWRALDLPRVSVVLTIDGRERGRGTGAAVLGDPLNVLDWTINHLSGRGIALEAGAVVSTGTATGLVYLAPGQTAVADFGPLGRIELQFTGPAHPANVVPAA